jgi:hypothetical protein
MVWRLLLVKHILNLSYGALEREVRAFRPSAPVGQNGLIP